MTNKLADAFAEAAKLPIDEQESFAAFLLEELHDESRWHAQFTSRLDVLEQLASEARAENLSGLTEPLDGLIR